MRIRHTQKAVRQTVSSTKVHRSKIRVSKVGNRALGRTSHQIIEESSITLARHQRVDMPLVIAPAIELFGQASAGQPEKIVNRKLFRPVSSPSQNGEETLSARRCGRK